MDAKSIVVGLLIGGAAGSTASLLFGGQTAAPAPLVAPAVPEASAAPPESGGSPPVDSASPEPPSASDSSGPAIVPPAAAGGTTANPGAKPTLGELLAAIPVGDTPAAAGAGTIHGRVLTSDGKPLAGITVVAKLAGSLEGPVPPGTRALDDDELESAVRRFVAAWHHARNQHHEATTDAGGRYRLTGLADAPWRISPKIVGYAISTSDERAWAGVHPDAKVDFTAEALCEVRIDVRMPDGSQATAATIIDEHEVGEHASGRSRRRWRPGSTLRLSEGKHTLSAVVAPQGEGVEYESAEQQVELKAGGEAPTVVLKLTDRIAIRGTVTFPEDELEPSGRVHLLRLAPGTEPNAERLQEDGDADYVFDRRGTFEFPGLKPGRYAIGLSRGHFAPLVGLAVVEVGTQVATHDITVPPLDPKQHWIVRVVGPEGGAVTDCSEFGIHAANDAGSGRVFVEAIQKRDGGYWLWAGEAGARPDGQGDAARNPLTLKVESSSLGVTRVSLDASKGSRVEVRYAAPATLSVTLRGYSEEALKGRLILRLRAAGGPLDDNPFAAGGRPKIDSDGETVLGPQPPGRYLLVLAVRVKDYQEIEVQRRSITLEAGHNSEVLAAPTLHDVAVRIPDAATSLGVRLVPLGATGMAAMGLEVSPDESGAATLRGLPAGGYRLVVARGPGRIETMRLKVPADGPVVFKAEAVNVLRAMIRDLDGTLGKAGFRTDDLVVAIGGKEFSGMEQIQALIAEAMQSGTVDFGIVRKGASMTLSVPAAALMDPRKTGGVLEPESR